MRWFKRRSDKEREANEHGRSILTKIKVLGKFHKQEGQDLKGSIKALARLYAFSKGIIPGRNPKDKRWRS